MQPILHVWINHDNDLVDLTITKTIKQGKATKPVSEVLHTNKKHPFLTVEKGFLPVGQIKLGMHVVEADGQVGVISGWKVVPGVKAMYNLEVAQDHTYVVGSGQWIVHNSSYCGGKVFDGAKMTINDTLDAGQEFLGKNYKEIIDRDGPGRFVSEDGTRQFRIKENDIMGNHAGAPHANFEVLGPNPTRPGKLRVVEDIHVFFNDK